MTGPLGPTSTPADVRAACRANRCTRPTAGLAADFVQANLVILPAAVAAAFERFCRANPQPCPLLEVTPPGVFEPARSAPGADLRTDLPAYRVFEHGTLVEQCPSITHVWREDFVAFLIGCSFTFEAALLEAGLPVRHLEEGKNVPMFRTNVSCRPSPPFAGPMVVSMRPLTAAQARRAAEITAEYPLAHGAPVQMGHPAALGIADLAVPDYGDAVTVHPDEVPVFWACGVTPMEAILRARPAIAVTHEPGHMFVTDWRHASLRGGGARSDGSLPGCR